MTATTIRIICPIKETITVQLLLVFPCPSTNVCSNIRASFPSANGSALPHYGEASPRTLLHRTALVELLRTVSVRAGAAGPPPTRGAGGPPGAGLRLRSA